MVMKLFSTRPNNWDTDSSLLDSTTNFFVERRERVEQCLDNAIGASSDSRQRLVEAMRYSTLRGGKRIRALFVYASGYISEPDKPFLCDSSATSIEMMHAYSLIHDDLPSMDDDALRRGKPTCHIAFDEATAILAGDGLQALAFEHLTSTEGIAPEQKVEMLTLLAKSSGINGMVGGQTIDLLSEGKAISVSELEEMHRLKTGALIRASVILGALATNANSELIDLLSQFSVRIGLAFQIQDDILDHTSTTEQLGKNQGSDAEKNKSTYVSLLGLEESRRRADQLYNEALSCLDPLGNSAVYLRSLARQVVKREK